MNKISLKSKKLAKVLFAILFAATILTGCENNGSEIDKTIDNPSNPSVPSVVGEKINSVSITKEPIKTQYEVGDKFDAIGLEVNVNKTTSYSDNTTKTSDVSVKYVDEKDSFKFIFDSSKAGTVNVSVSYKGVKVPDNDTISVTVSEKGGNDTSSTTINGIKVENNVISLESLDNISALQTLPEEDKEIAKKVTTLNIEFPENKDNKNYSVNLVDISKLATNFPNAKITASDNIEYTINGGNGRISKFGPNGEALKNIIDKNEFADLTQFEIDGEIKIVKSIDYSTTDLVDDFTEIKTITVGNGSKLNITGKYLDIGRNRFVNNAGNDGITLPSDIEITTYNGDRKSITSDIAIDQYKQLGLTTPKFDLTISDENAYNFAKNILENYSYDQLNSLDSNNVKEHKLSINNYIDGEKALYTGDTLNANVPSLKYDTIDFIKPSEVKNLKITGTPSVKDTTSSRGYTNVVFTGDMSSITFDGLLNGVIEFKDNPMKNILSENALVKVNKIDAPIGTIRARILDFRGLPDYDNYSPLISNVKIGGTGETTGYFKNTAQKEALKDKIIDITSAGYHNNDFEPAYSADVDSEKAQMKTLQSVAEEADESIKQ